MSSFRYPTPDTPEQFERLCLRLLQKRWDAPSLQLFGKKGESQSGIDILDLSGMEPLRAAQCKLKEPHKSLRPAEISKEVELARMFSPPIGRFAILTTGKVSTQAQQRVTQLNQAYSKDGLVLELLTWDEIQQLLEEYPEVADEFYGGMRSKDVRGVNNSLNDLKLAVETMVPESSDSDIEEARALLDKHDYQLARLLALRVKQRKWNSLTQEQRASVLTIIAVSHLGVEEYDKAAQLFAQAKDLSPDEEKTIRNEALGYLITGDTGKAFQIAGDAKQKYPNSPKVNGIWLNAAPEGRTPESLEAEIPTLIRSDAEVAAALGKRFLFTKKFREAEHYARLATKSTKEWSTPWLLFGQVLTRRTALPR